MSINEGSHSHQTVPNGIRSRYGVYHSILFWAYAFVDKCKSRKSKGYISWKRKVNEWGNPSSKENKYCCADLAMSGIKLYQTQNYNQAIEALEQSNNIFPNTIVQLALCESYVALEQYDKARKILVKLLRYKWQDITRYLDSCCMSPFLLDLNTIANGSLGECLEYCLLNKIKAKWTIQYESCLEYTYNNHIWNNLDNKDKINNLILLARSKFWNNKYMDSLRIVRIIYELCRTHLLALDFHACRLCYIVLFYTNEHQLFEHFYRQQTFLTLLKPKKVCDCGDDQNCDSLAQKMKMDNAFALYMKTVTDVSLMNEDIILDTLAYTEARYSIYTAPMVALYQISIGEYETANYLFCKSAKIFINDVQNSEQGKRCTRVLCLGIWFSFLIYSMHIHYELRDYKMAKYFYQITLNQKKNDGVTHYHYGILLASMGKLKLSKKHLNKAKEFKEINSMNDMNLDKYNDIET